MAAVTVIIPCKNEAATIGELVAAIRERHPDFELRVIDDGSTDDSGELAAAAGAEVLRQPYSMGNGAAIKAGVRAAGDAEIVVCMDADGQHRPDDIGPLLEALTPDYAMVVGARSSKSQASFGRRLANGVYNWFGGWMVGRRIDDLTSGFRAVRRRNFAEFLHLLPNGFSYPTTITMAFFRAGYGVRYVPIEAERRAGKSHIAPLRDGIRFLLIIFKVGTLYSPLKLFFPASAALLAAGLAYYAFTFLTQGRFTNMGALLLLTSITVFLIGLVSEQITALLYSDRRS